MAQVKQDPEPETQAVSQNGLGLVGGLLAKAVLVTTRDGEVTAAHCEVDRLRPWVASVLHQPLGLVPAPLREAIRQTVHGLEPDRKADLILPAHSGLSEMFHAVVTPTRDGCGSISGCLVAIYDETPVREVCSNLAQLVRLASIGAISAGQAHEIKNTMVAINTFVHILVDRHGETELAPIVSREIRRIDHIVAQMLRVSHPKRSEFRPVALHELIEHSLSVVQHRVAGSAIQLVRHLQAEPDTVMGDASQLEQALVNLIYNAVDALGTQGTVTVASRVVTRPEAGSPAPFSEGTSWVRVTISDTGAGIPPEVLPRLFEPFFTTKSGGNGLGLVVTKQIVREHGGHIRVDSRVGQGTTFTLELPAAPRQAP